MSGVVETGTYLDRILARTAVDVETRKRLVAASELESLAANREACIDLRASLSGDRIAVISEIKRASPSKGRFPVEIDPASLAADYVAGGASAISVLTDEPFFQGSLADMTAAAEVAHAGTPKRAILRKDFVLDVYQLLEAKAFGADAALLIVAALEQSLFEELAAAAAELGLSTLVEVHDEAELERAVVVGSRVIGVNNRDLRSFHVDLAVTERLASLCPEEIPLVSESGIFTRADVERVSRAGASAILVGEALIVSPDRKSALADLASVSRTVSVSA
jgi:indole-3-glycerol phosphate synthase